MHSGTLSLLVALTAAGAPLRAQEAGARVLPRAVPPLGAAGAISRGPDGGGMVRGTAPRALATGDIAKRLQGITDAELARGRSVRWTAERPESADGNLELLGVNLLRAESGKFLATSADSMEEFSLGEDPRLITVRVRFRAAEGGRYLIDFAIPGEGTIFTAAHGPNLWAGPYCDHAVQGVLDVEQRADHVVMPIMPHEVKGGWYNGMLRVKRPVNRGRVFDWDRTHPRLTLHWVELAALP